VKESRSAFCEVQQAPGSRLGTVVGAYLHFPVSSLANFYWDKVSICFQLPDNHEKGAQNLPRRGWMRNFPCFHRACKRLLIGSVHELDDLNEGTRGRVHTVVAIEMPTKARVVRMVKRIVAEGCS
jgi:hypothetical protein